MSRTFVALCGVIIACWAAPASGQLFENATLTYQNMTMQWDVRHRGGFDVPICAQELMNCWEVVKPDLVCKDWITYESVCMTIRNYLCNDLVYWGDQSFYSSYHLFEEFCE